jgi:hypothetical protein
VKFLPGDPKRQVGRRLLGSGPVTLFFQAAVLDDIVSELRDSDYHVVELDASRWLTVKDMYWDFARVFRFEHDHADPQGFGECLAESLCGQYGAFDDTNGVAIVMTGYDQFARDFPDTAHSILDVIADRSRGALLNGDHFVCLLQSDDPRLELPTIGAIPVRWNDAEWLNTQRGV